MSYSVDTETFPGSLTVSLLTHFQAGPTCAEASLCPTSASPPWARLLDQNHHLAVCPCEATRASDTLCAAHVLGIPPPRTSTAFHSACCFLPSLRERGPSGCIFSLRPQHIRACHIISLLAKGDGEGEGSSAPFQALEPESFHLCSVRWGFVHRAASCLHGGF